MMKKYNIIFVILLLVACSTVAMADSIFLSADDVTIPSSTTQQANIVLQTAPLGYSGCNLTLTIADPTKAQFTTITYPSWSALHSNSALYSGNLTFVTIDTSRSVEIGAVDTTLVTVGIRWLGEGSTTYTISTITSIEDDSGNNISVVVEEGNIYLGGGVVITRDAIDVTNNSCTFVGNLATGFEDDVWFEYGMSPDTMNIATEKIHNYTGNNAANFTKPMPGTVMFRGQTYYYKAVSGQNGNGSVMSFTIPINSSMYLPQVFEPEQTRYEQFVEADFNFSQMAAIVSDAYFNVWGAYFYGLLFIGIFGAYWLRHEDVTLPTFLYILLSFTIRDYIPPDWRNFIYISIAIAMAAMLYTLYRNLRNR